MKWQPDSTSITMKLKLYHVQLSIWNLIFFKEGEADFAVMAIENARSGSILYNYTLLRESGMKILGEHNLRIKQNLMALPDQKITDIKEIRSHPIALAQCMTFLNQFPGITLIESDDTAGSAKQISENQYKRCCCNCIFTCSRYLWSRNSRSGN